MLVIGPFNCLPYRISESILKPLSIRQGMRENRDCLTDELASELQGKLQRRVC